MSRKRAEPDPVREGLLQACHQVVAAGGVVLVARDGQPFAFYPAHAGVLAQDPGAPARLREAVERRLEKVRAEAIRAAKAGLAVGTR
jgi:hypothetical protein